MTEDQVGKGPPVDRPTAAAREAALREILSVISRSRDDAAPVFETLRESVQRLFGASNCAIVLGEEGGGPQVLATQIGASETTIQRYREGFFRMDPEVSIAARAIIAGETLYYPDVAKGAPYLEGMEAARMHVEVEGIRTSIYAPLLLNGRGIGCINLLHDKPRAYSPDDIALLETFAAQAVIAIENVRQFRELQNRLEREQATREVLSVISRSRDDDAPVFDVILGKAATICAADQATLQLVSEDRSTFRLAAGWGLAETAFPIGAEWPLKGSQPVPQAILSGRSVNVADFADTEWYRAGEPTVTRIVNAEGVRSRVAVPLLRDGVAVGAISLSRREVRPFDDADVQVVETFAAQAVIAIENVRQFKALETLNAELGDRVDAQVGELERMGRLKRFLPAQVADAVVTKGDDILSSHRALIATLFCDMRGFTAFCERAEPEETIEVLQTYHEEMGRLLSEFGAGVEHRLGDGIMAIFNDPLPCDDPAGDAVRLAIAMRARMAELCKGWRRLGHRLGFGVGVSLGYATVGMVGSEGRYEYTASGTAVNLASRLCDRAEDGEILISARAFAAVEGDFEIEPHGEVTLKGIQDPAPVFRVA